ncbi:hypothetical protein EV401DRAFT_2027368 [Pisolithus croceorrhizus]|nr:hypothetical protein EV401DRAFT_2027368 [Pisolithus croceorrhizus]
MGCLEDKDSNPPSCKTVKAIHKVLCGGWVELFIHGLMENAFPDFKFANDEWKVDYLASMTYPAWWKVMLDNNEAGPGKCFKATHKEEDDLPSSTSMTSLSPPITCFEPPPIAPPTETMHTLSTDTPHNGKTLTALALATSKVQDIPLLSPLDTTQESPPDSMDLDNVMSNAMLVLELESTILPAATPTLSMICTYCGQQCHISGSGKAKMCPGPSKNGHNPCAHCWCKQAQPNVQHPIKMQAYNDEATVLATSNNWDTKTICNGTLH